MALCKCSLEISLTVSKLIQRSVRRAPIIGRVRQRSSLSYDKRWQALEPATTSRSDISQIQECRETAAVSREEVVQVQDIRELGEEVQAPKDDRRLRRENSRKYESDPPVARSPSDIILKKRNGQSLDAREIHWFIDGFHRGFVKDYQMSSFLMAVCWRGMSNREVSDMTTAMVNTGKTADLSRIHPLRPKIDKHSTGGVGDKVSLVLTPLAASLGLVVPMMSGRGLGHTGGTLDKLSAIPGFRTDISTLEYLAQLERISCAIVAPTEEYAPVDRAIFALRDVTGTIENVGLVASSIMSKKLAEKPDALLLDVKMGGGAFFKSLNDAASLASTMVAIGEDAGIATCCMVSSMDQPLGSAVGNWLEAREAIHILNGRNNFIGDDLEKNNVVDDVIELTLSQVALMLGLGGFTDTYNEGYELAREKLASGDCLEKFIQLVVEQGGDPKVVYNLEEMPLSNDRKQFCAPFDCVIESIDAHQIGLASVTLGAGRHYQDDEIDYHAGLLLHEKVGCKVKKGEPIFTAFASDVAALYDPKVRLEDGFDKAKAAYKLAPHDSDYVIKDTKLIEYFVDRTGVQPFEIIKDG